MNSALWLYSASGRSGPWSAEAGIDASPREPPTTIRIGRGKEIARQDGPAEYCFLVHTGCVRSVKLMRDGRRQVGEFLFRGDLFGWEALDKYEFGAEAVTATTVHRIRLGDLETLIRHSDDFARSLRECAARQVRSGRDHMVLLGRKNAFERIASFVLEFSGRMRTVGRSRIELPMCRDDIADYLGLTVETVSRQLTVLRQSGAIAIERAKIVIYDSTMLDAAVREPVECRSAPRWSRDNPHVAVRGYSSRHDLTA